MGMARMIYSQNEACKNQDLPRTYELEMLVSGVQSVGWLPTIYRLAS